jgi:hypothetical protein
MDDDIVSDFVYVYLKFGAIGGGVAAQSPVGA